MTTDRRRARAYPTKTFFVRMLTRDISLDDCILDLVDNSIDGARALAGTHGESLEVSDALSNFRIDIEITDHSFSVTDNCGGINLDDAVNYAFTFGRRPDDPTDDFSVGVYGIGMKRALFKLGSNVQIRSTYSDNGELRSFAVPIDVDEWLDEDDWDFRIEESNVADAAGVEIHVGDLHPDTARAFGSPQYLRRLTASLSRDYMLPLMHGLTITLNGKAVVGKQLALIEGDDFEPMRTSYRDGDVQIEILAGMAGSPPDDVSPEEPGRGDDTSGWYVFCNGRAVLTADRTQVTGWGTDVPRWHTQYSGFVGVVLFSARNPGLLPMTTTKRSVDTSSGVYARALGKMVAPARAWVAYTNARKSDISAARERERAAVPTAISQVALRPSLTLPTVTRSSEAEMANVNYAVPLKRMRALAKGFGRSSMSYRDVGLKSFDFAFDELADDD